MTILAFYAVNNELGWGRDEFPCLDDERIFKKMWGNRNELKARFYAIDVNPYSDPTGMYGIYNAYNFMTDYNDELLDGGWWVQVLDVDNEFVKNVILYESR